MTCVVIHFPTRAAQIVDVGMKCAAREVFRSDIHRVKAAFDADMAKHAALIDKMTEELRAAASLRDRMVALRRGDA